LALRHLRLIPSLAALPTTPSRVYTPHSAATERYAIAAHRQKRLYERMIVAPFL
jgi:hypothetical protein